MEETRPLDRMLFGGMIYAGARCDRRVDAVGIRNGRIACLGSRQQLQELCGGQTVREDLGEKCLLPAFLDPHNHFSICSLAPLMADCRTPPLRTLDEVLEKMKEKAEQTEAGRWVLGFGYEENLLKEGRDPVAADLDRACPDHPAVLMHVSLHSCVANSLALQVCGYDHRSSEPQGGRIGRTTGGRPSGILVEKAAMKAFDLARADKLLLPPGAVEQLFARNRNRLLRLGIVKVADAAVGPRERDLYRAASEHDVPVPRDWMEVGDDGMFSPPEELIRKGSTGTSVVKLFLDGAGQCALEFSVLRGVEGILKVLAKVSRGKLPKSGLRALLKAETRLSRDGMLRLGFFLNEPERLETLVTEAHRQGLPVATHALGNLAVKQMLEIYERVQARYGPPRTPFRIEHALFLTQDLIDHMARLGVAAVVQPAFLFQYGTLFRSLPLPGAIKVLPLRRMLDAGILVAGSSDGPCGPEDPMLAMDCAVRRTIPDNEVLDADQALRVGEAIQLYTGNAARVMGCGSEQGELAEGKRADLVVLSGDPFQKAFVEIRVVETLLAGETVWRRKRLDSPLKGDEEMEG